MTLRRPELLRAASVSVLADAGVDGTALVSDGSVMTIRKVSGSVASVSLYSKGLDGTYRLAQADTSGTVANMTWTFTGNQPIRVVNLGYREFKLVGDATGVIEVTVTG
jgi:hypothetical protein